MLEIQNIRLKNFRCFEHVDLRITEPLVIITGKNGSGKSSLIEAIYCCCFSKSFRTSDSSVLKKYHMPSFSIELCGKDDSGDHWEIKRVESEEHKEFFLNNKRAATYKQLISSFRAIIMSEEDLAIITGGPEARRTFIDKAIAIHDATYITLLQQHKKIIAQKQALLRTTNPHKSTYQLFHEQQVELDQKIFKIRNVYGNLLIRKCNDINSTLKIVDQEITFNYLAASTYSYTQELQTKRVLFGCHKDNPQFFLNDKPSRFFASRGQQKALLILLKLAQVEILQKPCILLIDDFLTDLDNEKSQKILQLLTKHQIQIFIASPILETLQDIIKTLKHQVVQI